MGTTTYSVWYANKISGWSSRLSVLSQADAPTAALNRPHDIIIGEPTTSVGADRPILLCVANNILELAAFYGNALNATSWTSNTNITGAVDVEVNIVDKYSMVIDSNGKITIAFPQDTTRDLHIVEHLASQSSWGTWETPVEIDTGSYTSPSMTLDGTDRYIFVEEVTASDINLWVDTGSGFSEATDNDLPNAGTFNDVKVKWARYNNNSPTKFDYVFQLGIVGAINYNSYPDEVPTADRTDFWHGPIPQPLFLFLISLIVLEAHLSHV
jgi:hypothetical protein